jgi:hypothetical protein
MGCSGNYDHGVASWFQTVRVDYVFQWSNYKIRSVLRWQMLLSNSSQY